MRELHLEGRIFGGTVLDCFNTIHWNKQTATCNNTTAGLHRCHHCLHNKCIDDVKVHKTLMAKGK